MKSPGAIFLRGGAFSFFGKKYLSMHSKRRKREQVFLDAVRAGDAATVTERLSAGVSVEARNREHGETALMLAAQFGRDAVVALLLQAGADVNARNATGRTPLMLAKAKAALTLLAAGARIDAQDDDGETALMKAASSADVDTVKALLGNGADSALTDYDDRSAWDRASDLGVLILMDLLEPGYSLEYSMEKGQLPTTTGLNKESPDAALRRA